MRLRQILWHHLDPKAYQGDGLSPTNKAVIWLVVLSSLVAVVETEPLIEGMAPWAFAHVEQIFSIIFLTEYLARLWAEGENPIYSGFGGRLRYALSPPAIIDLIAFLPSLVIPGISSPMLLRMFRLMRILRLARLGRFSTALGHLTEAITQRRDELLLSLMLAAMILVFSAAAMYALEGENDPEAFGSIPRALWWSVCTLTTVGYGDIYPHSVLGKICGGLTSIAGIGLIAMPTGILAAAFSEAFQRTRHRRERDDEWVEPARISPHAHPHPG
jgi:voltage-gated potassium channel